MNTPSDNNRITIAGTVVHKTIGTNAFWLNHCPEGNPKGFKVMVILDDEIIEMMGKIKEGDRVMVAGDFDFGRLAVHAEYVGVRE